MIETNQCDLQDGIYKVLRTGLLNKIFFSWWDRRVEETDVEMRQDEEL